MEVQFLFSDFPVSVFLPSFCFGLSQFLFFLPSFCFSSQFLFRAFPVSVSGILFAPLGACPAWPLTHRPQRGRRAAAVQPSPRPARNATPSGGCASPRLRRAATSDKPTIRRIPHPALGVNAPTFLPSALPPHFEGGGGTNSCPPPTTSCMETSYGDFRGCQMWEEVSIVHIQRHRCARTAHRGGSVVAPRAPVCNPSGHACRARPKESRKMKGAIDAN